ncbi:MAG: hypothetical protein HY854_11445 [Burkholderiales bacterium]|nr:hypothetical protein [Burkholderiales bacterium]
MGLLKKLFGGGKEMPPGAGEDTEQGDESEATTEMSSRNAPRREVVQVVLRETMRRHGIPSDWIECRILSVASASRGPGMHVLLAVRDGQDRLVTYIHAFQDSFMQELLKFEPKAIDWVFSLSWQFEARTGSPPARQPDSVFTGAAASGTAAGAAAGEPREAGDPELEGDLEALYAALKQTGAGGTPDFEPTRPGLDDAEAGTGVRH